MFICSRSRMVYKTALSFSSYENCSYLWLVATLSNWEHWPSQNLSLWLVATSLLVPSCWVQFRTVVKLYRFYFKIIGDWEVVCFFYLSSFCNLRPCGSLYQAYQVYLLCEAKDHCFPGSIVLTQWGFRCEGSCLHIGWSRSQCLGLSLSTLFCLT